MNAVASRDYSAASKIVTVEARTVSIPLDAVTAFSTRKVARRDYTLVRVRTQDGHTGIGFCYAGSHGGTMVTHAVRELFAALLTGQSSLWTEALWEEMYQNTLLHGRTGSVMRAISILDIALWDRNARAAGLPLSLYLGGYTRGTVPAYASGGYYLEGKTPKMLGEEMAGYVALGFRAVKMKVGMPGPRQEEDRIAAAREAIGPDVLLMLDANNAWSDVATALEYLKRYEKYDPYWIEEPFSPDQIENHAQLARRTSVTVATGEIEAGRCAGRRVWRADFPALVSRSPRAPRRLHAERAHGRIFHRRPGPQLPAARGSATGIQSRRSDRADRARPRLRLRRKRGREIRCRQMGLTPAANPF